MFGQDALANLIDGDWLLTREGDMVGIPNVSEADFSLSPVNGLMWPFCSIINE